MSKFSDIGSIGGKRFIFGNRVFNNRHTDANNCTNINDDTNKYQYLKLEIAETNNILTVTLSRSDKKNAMSFAMMRELIDVAKWLKHNKTIQAVIINGEGDTFCSGIDLSDLAKPSNQLMALRELIKPSQSIFQQVCLIWREVPMPVITVMHGYCIGAGLQLALGTDIRISSPECQFAIMEAKWGLVADMGLTQSALHLVRADVLKELAMSARLISAEDALNSGLISHISERPLEQAQELAAEFATRSPDAVLAAKRIINRMTKQSHLALYLEKLWQLKLIVGHNRKLAIKKAKDSGVQFIKRQFR